MSRPAQHQAHARRYAASVILGLTYGSEEYVTATTPKVLRINQALLRVGQTLLPGRYNVDTWPILRFVPGYFRELKKWHKEELSLFREQLDEVREKMVSRLYLTLYIP